MSFAAVPAPRLVSPMPSPPCPTAVLSPDLERFVCLHGKSVSMHQTNRPLPPVWTAPVVARNAAFLTDRNRILFGLKARLGVVALDGETGIQLGSSPRWTGPWLDSGKRLSTSVGPHLLRAWDDEATIRVEIAACLDSRVHAALLLPGIGWRVLCLAAKSGLEVLGGPMEGSISHMATYEMPPGSEHPHLLMSTPDQTKLVGVSAEGDVGIFAMDGRLLSTGRAPTAHIGTAAVADLVALAGDRGGVTLWDPERSRVVARLPRIEASAVGISRGELVEIGTKIRRCRLPAGSAVRSITACPGGGSWRLSPGGTPKDWS